MSYSFSYKDRKSKQNHSLNVGHGSSSALVIGAHMLSFTPSRKNSASQPHICTGQYGLIMGLLQVNYGFSKTSFFRFPEYGFCLGKISVREPLRLGKISVFHGGPKNPCKTHRKYDKTAIFEDSPLKIRKKSGREFKVPETC